MTKKKIHIEKRIHQVWLEWSQIQSRLPIYRLCSAVVGKYQYIVSDEKGREISIVELPNYFREGTTLWEIYCLKGDLFADIERYSSYEKAVRRAKKYLLK